MFSSTLTRGARIQSFAVLGTFVAAIVFFGSERCGVVSNDEIGAVAEGFNAMVRGLREREAIRETFWQVRQTPKCATRSSPAG